jgi:phage terminase small subunit
MEVDKSRPHIYIPISHFIAELFIDEEKVNFINQLKLFSEDELRLVKELRNNNIERVTIVYDRDARKVTKIEYDKTGLMNGDKAKEVMRILGLKNYSTIQLKTRTGTSLSFTKTETKYF